MSGLIRAEPFTGTIVSDTFTDTNGTDLTPHTPDTVPAGSAWANSSATNEEVQTNKAQPEAKEVKYRFPNVEAHNWQKSTASRTKLHSKMPENRQKKRFGHSFPKSPLPPLS